ncbi:biotin-(acetyl-CoA carboxylase) ligase [Desulfocapsa sulfexigens DSM 10523]|uniref:Biotin-(Acetyl-CoA carboxylase) ligase n=1 Tax=Desulfocapsa sulfexigens (strain DSM 10523 / SB164P1) TaxID=1167006 RepID=M1PB99_DESSD|nr:biotin--[acetyl-CoA-carboxylase] ligase [Desulfocapsa sulfexigens]AGF77020.1 biotin-(acetyl-CoA carboxylase) ligase [Desulfocapsa sulfexigens DSM 10523]
MDNLTLLSPFTLDDYVVTVELPLRKQGGSPDSATVLRYGAYVGSVVLVYPSLGRAMDTAREHISSREESGRSVANGSVILASSLSLSKGRFCRSWYAPPGGLWGCLILADTFLAPFRNFLPLIPGIACCEALQQFGASEAAIRWVNDVLIQGRKQAGFLIEGFRSPVYGEQYHLLGFGLNLNNSTFPPELQETAISLTQVLGHSIDTVSFGLSFLAKMRYYIGLLLYEEERWLARGGGETYEEEHPILKRWKELSDTLGKRVLFGYDVMENPQYEAVVHGVTTDGGLILQHDDGSTSVENSGEVRYCRE